MKKELDDKLVLEIENIYIDYIYEAFSREINKYKEGYAVFREKSRQTVNERLDTDFSKEEFEKVEDCMYIASRECLKFGLKTELNIKLWRDKYYCNVFFREWYKYLYENEKKDMAHKVIVAMEKLVEDGQYIKATDKKPESQPYTMADVYPYTPEDERFIEYGIDTTMEEMKAPIYDNKEEGDFDRVNNSIGLALKKLEDMLNGRNNGCGTIATNEITDSQKKEKE